MIVGKLINWVIVIGVAYGSYQYLNLGPKEHLTTGHACVRKGGGMIKQGIFHCEIRLFNGLASYDTPPKATYTISLTKRNRQWQVIHQSPYKPFTNTL